MSTKNLMLSMSDELVRRVEVLAAQRGTSVSGLVARLLGQLVGEVPDHDEVAEAERHAMSDGLGLRVGPITWSRDDLHPR